MKPPRPGGGASAAASCLTKPASCDMRGDGRGVGSDLTDSHGDFRDALTSALLRGLTEFILPLNAS